MKFSRIASALAAGSLLVAPIAAQAGTRAQSSAVYPTTGYAASRSSATVEDENDLKPVQLLLLLLALGAAGYGISRAIDGKSNGAN